MKAIKENGQIANSPEQAQIKQAEIGMRAQGLVLATSVHHGTGAEASTIIATAKELLEFITNG